jgi:hypothetical protein
MGMFTILLVADLLVADLLVADLLVAESKARERFLSEATPLDAVSAAADTTVIGVGFLYLAYRHHGCRPTVR